MKNTIKRKSTKMKVRVLTDLSGYKKGEVIDLYKDGYGWHSVGYTWLVGIIRNENFIEILSQE